MATTLPQDLLRCLDRTVTAARYRSLTDRELLECYLTQRDQGAFEALLSRHAPRVFAVCRQVLGDQEDIDDAFQATFLVLLDKAGRIRWHDSLGSWLAAVAHRISVRARSRSRRRWREGPRAAGSESNSEGELLWREACAILHEELDRLPDRFRLPVLLCYLEGHSRDEAAGRLGWSLGTVKAALERGRARLRQRLLRRGVTLSAGLLAAVRNSVTAAILPPRLLHATLQAATATPSPGAWALLSGALSLKLSRQVQLVLGLLLTAGLCLGLGAATRPHPPGDTPEKGFRPVQAGRRMDRSDPDSDGDGLSDFHEVHKYRTDPKKKDTAGKGVSDGDWQQRREFTYSVRAVIRVMPPCNLKALTDDYQDVRVRARKKEYAELEVVVYPLNSNATAIKGNPNWKKDCAGMREYLAPGVTTNWDEGMRKELLRELAGADIDPDRLTDKEVVERVSRWLFQRARYRYMFCTFYLDFRGGKPGVLPGLERAFEREKGDRGWTVRQQLEHELFGKEMFANRSVGTCTSAAILQTTVLRALGIPTRMVLCIPLADASDAAQVAMVEKGLTHHRVRRDAFYGLLSGGGSFTSHTFCEAFVGGRWRRLNYTTLGQNVLDRRCLGLMVHVHTFHDLSEANLAATWGTRYAKGARDKVFRHSNPYRLMELSDHFGRYAKVPNPPAAEHRSITIGKAYWPGSKDVPASIQKHVPAAQRAWMEQPPRDGSGRLIFHGEEWLADAGDYLQYKAFLWRADPAFVLRAKGRPDVRCRVGGWYVTHATTKLRELEVVIPREEFAKMAKGTAYTIHPVNGKKGYQWRVRPGLTVTPE
jgi:RNA polymerase sigma factor (sigma-70 family)